MAWRDIELFRSLKVHNFRLYFCAHAITVTGTFVQQIALAWLVLELTHSGTILGIVSALQFLPLLILTPVGGLLADRFPKRKLFLATQSSYAALAVTIWLLLATGSLHVWMLYIYALVFGIVGSVNTPVRQSFISEMVGRDRTRNAVALNTAMFNLGRIIGPAIAAIIIAELGITVCFLVNALSYSAVTLALLSMRASELFPSKAVERARGQLREGLMYARREPIIFTTLSMVAIIGVFAYEYQVTLPLLAKDTFHGDATTFSLLTSAMGVGAIMGGLFIAGSKNVSRRILVWMATLLGSTTLITAVVPSIELALPMMVLIGFSSLGFSALANTTLQTASADNMRGRVMALWAMAWIGSTAIGGPIIGWTGEHIDPRWALAIGGFAALIAALIGFMGLRKATPVRPAAN